MRAEKPGKGRVQPRQIGMRVWGAVYPGWEWWADLEVRWRCRVDGGVSGERVGDVSVVRVVGWLGGFGVWCRDGTRGVVPEYPIGGYVSILRVGGDGGEKGGVNRG